MRTYLQAKAMAKSLRELLAGKRVSLSHSECLEVVAQQFGFGNWNVLAAKIDLETGAPTAFTPVIDGNVYSLVASDGTLYAAGSFGSIDHQFRIGLAAFHPATVDVPSPTKSGLRLAVSPSPFGHSARLSYALPRPALVTLRVFGVNGRQVATLVDHQTRLAGPHSETLEGAGLSPGVYLCLLEADGLLATTKVVRIR